MLVISSHFLFGDVLGISVSDMIALSVLVVALLLVIRALWKELLFATFDPLGAGAAGLPVRRLDDLLLILDRRDDRDQPASGRHCLGGRHDHNAGGNGADARQAIRSDDSESLRSLV